MSRLHTRFGAGPVAGALLAFASACSDGVGPAAPTPADAARLNADVAVVTGAAIASDLAIWAGSEAAAAAFAGPGAPSAGTCTRGGGATRCTGGREGTLQVTRTVSFFDAGGTTQQAYDAATTERIQFEVRATGTTSGAQFSSAVDRARSLSVTGLAGSESRRTWNGTGSATVTNTFTGSAGTRSVRVVESDTTSDVTWTVAPERSAYPASGTVVRRMNATTTLAGDRSATFTAARRVMVTFNGTARVPLEVSAVTRRGTTVALTCQLDLSTRGVACNQ